MTTNTKQENAILNDIIRIAESFNVSKTIESSDKVINIYCDNVAQRFGIRCKIDDIMRDKYPDINYAINLNYSRELLLEFRLW